MRMRRRRLIVILVLTMVMLAGVQVVGAADSQSWHLLGHDESEYSGITAGNSTHHHKDLFMNKTGNATAHNHMVLPNMTKKTTWWYAGYPAQFDGVTFGEDDWIVNISHSNYNDFSIFVDVCKVNESGEATYLAHGNKTASGKYTTITCSDNATTNQTFNKDERLALRIYHNRTGTTTTANIYYYNAGIGRLSNLTSPSSDPGYPVPELGTFILFSTGLIALAGYVLLAKRKK
ncbi:MAG: hypothetical protein AEth_00737 [Candidatus Argoarchaeum ethanivorans]|uniref:Uncharacterized protein n=1 Tax=Candidatus Argoarchaeum ethanivorans TaxID=2608793 RepID=A0A8B3S3Q9_9EURY|nr:MAG: hypothetical protein AEth_00737 [Candidatus Argoarchaeum ethanivorans]